MTSLNEKVKKLKILEKNFSVFVSITYFDNSIIDLVLGTKEKKFFKIVIVRQ